VLFASRPIRSGGLACLAALALAGVIARGAEPAPAPADPKARQLLDEVVRAYKGLSSYSDQGQFILNTTDNGKPENLVIPLNLTLVRPNKVNLDAGPVRIVSDGKTMTTAVAPSRKYMATEAPKSVTIETFRQGPIGSALFGGPAAPPMIVLLNFLAGDDPAQVVAELGGTLRLGADRKEGRVLLVDRDGGPDVELVVDAPTKLLRAIYLLIDPKALAEEATPGHKFTIGKFGWEAGTISTRPVKDETFAYTPPRDFTKVEWAAPPGQEEKSAVKALVGKPAPEFTLTVLDGAKTRTITKADLAGKVVLLDFWATWCPPCLAELPDVQKLIEGYAKANKDVVVVALSEDQEPRELDEVRKLVETTLQEKKVTLTGTPVGKIALDPSGSVGEAFSIQVLPTLVILDAKGIVQAVYLGQQTKETLTKDIDALLAGQSLVKPEAKEAAARDGAGK